MKISYDWLKEWVDPQVEATELGEQLTMAGVQVDALHPASSAALDSIVAARVTSCEPHPDADKLSVCEVDDGNGIRSIVCGDPGVYAGMCAPLAPPGVRLPGGLEIKSRTIRGVQSDGMLCSPAELGLSDDAAHLLELPPDTVPGTPVHGLIGLDDTIFEFDLTPNRGDCLSVLGIAREIAAIHGLALQDPDQPDSETPVAGDETLDVQIDDLQACRAYFGRIVRGVDVGRSSPLWLQERLRRSGIRPINAVVDATAYVMLELGQPLHAFDLGQIRGPVSVRWARDGETLELLDDTHANLKSDMLVVADANGPVALAGIIGGANSAVSGSTRDIFLESACFTPQAVIGRARRLGLHTEASQRFERGVDPAVAIRALERATRLITRLAGGDAAPVCSAGKIDDTDSKKRPILLRRDRIEKLLGMRIDDGEVQARLESLEMSLKPEEEGWQVTPPTHRYDIDIESDLIEEVARLHGYDKIPVRDAATPDLLHAVPEARVPESRLREALVQRGYHEVITYSFVDPVLQRKLMLDYTPVDLVNPISQDLAQMRTSLWPGLVACLGYNLNRQQDRVRIFETGLVFRREGETLDQLKMIAALAWGPRDPEQWGLPQQRADFHDMKGDLEALLESGLAGAEYRFEAAGHPGLHPGQAARVLRNGKPVGWIGALHPAVTEQLDLPYSPVLFEVAADSLLQGRLAQVKPVSRYPALRRDLALLVPEAVEIGTLAEAVRANAPKWLQEIRVFDIYRGQGIEEGLKSIALGLILQESSRTLTDSEADEFVQGLIAHLKQKLDARIRD